MISELKISCRSRLYFPRIPYPVSHHPTGDNILPFAIFVTKGDFYSYFHELLIVCMKNRQEQDYSKEDSDIIFIDTGYGIKNQD